MKHVDETLVEPVAPVLVVDLDGTLIKTDLLVETALDLLGRSPLSLALLPVWLVHGKAHLKAEIAERVEIDAASLPYNTEFLAFLRAEHDAGRKIWLATASHRKLADRVADHLGIFDRVLATEHGHNLGGKAKRDALVSNFGPKGFDYAGNALVDLHIWPQARRALVVHPGRGVGTTVPVIAKLNGFSFASLLAIATAPVRIPSAPGAKVTVYMFSGGAIPPLVTMKFTSGYSAATSRMGAS